MIFTIESENDFKNIKDNWNRLYSDVAKATIFQSYDYNIVSWDTICKTNTENKLYILLHYPTNVRKESDAIFPFYIDKNKRLRFINDIHTDLCDGLISDKSDNKYDIISELYLFIEKDENIKSVFLDNMPHYSCLSNYLKIFKENTFLFSNTEHSFINYVKSNDPILSLHHIKASNRYNLKHIYEECKDLNFRIYTKASSDEYPEKDIKYMVNRMISKGIRTKEYFDPTMLSFWENIYNNLLTEITVLYDEQMHPLSIGIVFSEYKKQEFIRWIILYDNKKYNSWNDVRYFIEKAQNNSGTIDFGRGGYFYKTVHFKPTIENIYRLMYSKTLWGNWYIFFKINISHLRKTLSTLRK